MRNLSATESMHQRLCELLPRLRRFAHSLAGNPHDADDVVQLALERALQRSTQWQGERGGLDAWMFGIVRNAWLDEARARQRRGRVFVAAEDGEDAGVDSVEPYLQALSVEAALARLPGEQREAVALVLVEGFSYREASELLEVPIGTLTSRLARGRQALQQMLGESA